MQELPVNQTIKKRSFGLKYPCDAIVTTLILNNIGDYDSIMNMSFESVIKTFACFYIQNLDMELGSELNKVK